MATKQFGLGKGLGSLIPQKKDNEPSSPVAEVFTGQVLEVPVEDISVNPHQPRRTFDRNDLEDLMASIEKHGILQPLVVTKKDGKYELIAGERRLRSSKEIGLEKVPIIVRTASEQEKLELALIENVQRADLNAVEEALAYQALVDQFQLTQEQISDRVGKGRSTVANILRLLDLEPEILQALKEGKITRSHARTLLGETDKQKRLAVFKEMLTGKVTVRQAESRVSGKKKNKTTKEKDPNIAAHEKTLQEALGTKVLIEDKGGKGKISIDYYSRQDLLSLLDQLTD